MIIIPFINFLVADIEVYCGRSGPEARKLLYHQTLFSGVDMQGMLRDTLNVQKEGLS